MDMTTMHKLSYGLFVLTAREGEKETFTLVTVASAEALRLTFITT